MSASSSLRAKLRARVGRLAIDVELDTDVGTLALVGPNGSGKTTLLSLLLGTERCESAQITIGETVLADTAAGIDVPAEQRRLAYVPQDYALFPHLSVRENVAFAVASASPRIRRAQRDAQVESALRELGILALATRRPSNLSGGEQQRVALARALSVKPRALLLDEPLSALDVHSRRDVRAGLKATLAELRLPTIVVTHSPCDACALATRIAVLEAGKITQVGNFEALGRNPATPFIAAFVASAQERP